MTHLVFFLEEPSAKAMLEGLLPRLLPDDVYCQYVVFEGKQALEKRLPIRLKAWQAPNTLFVVLRDQDSGDCIDIKKNLVEKCIKVGKPDVLVRIACRELESWYLGDLQAVENGLNLKTGSLSAQQNKSTYRSPDRLPNPVQILTKIAPQYQKVSGSREIGIHLDINKNCSTSFGAFLRGVRHLIT